MKNFLQLHENSPMAGWIIFLATLLLVGIAVTVVVLWMVAPGSKSKKHRRRRRRRHSQQHNPTLSQSGGLPPMRDPNQPPPGP